MITYLTQAGSSRQIINWHGGTSLPIGSVRFKKRRSSATLPVMTALVSAFTNEGFVVGADSLRIDRHGRTVTEDAIKIYPTNHPVFVGAYGFAGNTALEYADGRILDLLILARDVADDSSRLPFKDALSYVKDFCEDFADRIRYSNIGVALPDGEEFCRVMFVGYHHQTPVRLQVSFSVARGILQSPRLKEMVESPVADFCIASGSQIVWDDLTAEVCKPETLSEGIEFVRNYVVRCINTKTDPCCAAIGGHPQIATITDGGFSWVVR